MKENNKIKILKDYIDFCNFLKIDTKKKTSKNKYVNIFMKNYSQFYGIVNYEKKEKEIKDILKYNPLTIEILKKGGVKNGIN